MALEVASLYATMGLDKRNFEAGMRGVDGSLKGVAGTLKAGLGGAAIATAGALVGVSAVVGGIAASSVMAAASMEEQLSGIAAVMGKAKDEVEPLKALIIDLGMDPNLKVNATEAADAIEMLARNGLTMDEILSGAAKSTVLLSNATGGAFDTAANIATDSMAIFNIEAADMIDAVDGITSVTVNSKFDVEDYGLALAQAGGAAASSGVEFDDFNTVIAGISPLFASGSDAGTSFKTMLQRLIPSTTPAKDAMKDLGILAEDGSNAFFDASGNLKSMGDIAGILQSSLSGLSEEQRNTALSTIFGTDAMRAAVGMMGLGSEGFASLQETMKDTSATDSAATRMDNFAGTIEIITGVFEGMKLKIGDALLPTMQKLADKLLVLADDIGPKVTDFAEKAGEKLFTWVEMIEQGNFDGVMSNVGELLTQAWINYVAPALSKFSGMFWDWATGPGGAIEGAGTALDALAQEAADWTAENWPTIQTSLAEWANRFWDWITGPGGALERLGETMSRVTSDVNTWAASAEGQGRLETAGETLGAGLIAGIQGLLSTMTSETVTTFGRSMQNAFSNIGETFMNMGTTIGTSILSGLYEKLTGQEISDNLKSILRSAIESALSVVAPMFGGGLFNITPNFTLPQFDTGGIVPGATGSPQLIMAHGGETVLPTHKTGSSGQTFNITVNANDSAGGQRAGNAFVDALRARGMVMA